MNKRKFTGFLMICILLAWLMMPVRGENKGSTPALFQPQSPPHGIIYAYPQSCRTLDPATARDDASALVISNIFEGLVKFSKGSSKIEPCLAHSWEVSEDGLEWTFYLRRGVKFHDGTSFDAKAVKFSVERQLNDSTEMIYARFVYGPLKEIQVIDDYTVKFILKYPYTPFLNNLAMPFAAPVVSPASVKRYGTGPYKLSSWQKDVIKLSRNNAYWGEQPKSPAITFITIPSEEERINLLKKGEIHIASHVSPQKAQILKLSGFKSFRVTGLDISYLGLYVNKPPFSYHAARKAVDIALDRVLLVQKTLNGQGVPAASYLPPSMISKNYMCTTPDRSKAKELLASVPFQDKNITIITYAGTRPYNRAGGETLAHGVAEQLRAIGLKVNVKPYDWNQYKKALARQEGDAFLYGWISDNGDPDNFLYPSFAGAHIDTGLNISHFQNQELDTLLLDAQRSQKPAVREELYLKSLDILENEVPWVVLNHSLRITITSPSLSGYTPHPTGWDRLNNTWLE